MLNPALEKDNEKLHSVINHQLNAKCEIQRAALETYVLVTVVAEQISQNLNSLDQPFYYAHRFCGLKFRKGISKMTFFSSTIFGKMEQLEVMQ